MEEYRWKANWRQKLNGNPCSTEWKGLKMKRKSHQERKTMVENVKKKK